MTEVQKFDIARRESIFLATPSSKKYGSGYVRECGTCVDYCTKWPGEVHKSKVETQVLSCGKSGKKKSKKGKKKEKH